MCILKYLIAICFLIGQSGIAREAPSCPRIIDYIENHLPLQGRLQFTSGFVYVDVDDDYIHCLIPFIEREGFEEPPYFGRSDLVGAHITVIYPEEVKKYRIHNIKECGKTIHFSVKTCQVVQPPSWGGDEIYLIIVDVPELNKIRDQYGLPKSELPFHITIGVKPKVAKAA